MITAQLSFNVPKLCSVHGVTSATQQRPSQVPDELWWLSRVTRDWGTWEKREADAGVENLTQQQNCSCPMTAPSNLLTSERKGKIDEERDEGQREELAADRMRVSEDADDTELPGEDEHNVRSPLEDLLSGELLFMKCQSAFHSY